MAKPHGPRGRDIYPGRDKREPHDDELLSDLEAERAVLGSLVFAPALLPLAQTLIRAEHFSHPAHSLIFSAYGEAAARIEKTGTSAQLDFVAVCAVLRDWERLNAVGGMQYIGELAECVPTAANLENHCRIVVELSQRRALLAQVTQLRRAILTAEMADVERALAKCADVTAALAPETPTDLYTAMISSFEVTARAIEDRASGREPSVGVPLFGIARIDARLPTGAEDGDTVVIAGGTSAGKSTLAQQSSETIATARPDEIVIVASLEMTRASIAQRAISRRAAAIDIGNGYSGTRSVAVPLHVLKTGAFTEDQYAAFEGTMNCNLEIYQRIHVIDDMSLGMQGLRSAAVRLSAKCKRKIAAIFVDYLQLMTPDDEARRGEQAVAWVSRQCKLLAMQMRCVVVLLSQFNREYADKDRPRLSHLKGGSAIEQDASTVILLHRPNLAEGKTDVYVDKGRNTGVFQDQMTFDGERLAFY